MNEIKPPAHEADGPRQETRVTTFRRKIWAVAVGLPARGLRAGPHPGSAKSNTSRDSGRSRRQAQARSCSRSNARLRNSHDRRNLCRSDDRPGLAPEPAFPPAERLPRLQTWRYRLHAWLNVHAAHRHGQPHRSPKVRPVEMPASQTMRILPSGRPWRFIHRPPHFAKRGAAWCQRYAPYR